MPEETECTFAHFVEDEALAARVADFDGRYTEEEMAATAYYFGVLAITGFAHAVPLYGDPHYLAHLMANIFAGEWLTELIRSGSVFPDAMYEFVMREHGDFLKGTMGTEDIKVEKSPGEFDPMDNETFARLWGGHA